MKLWLDDIRNPANHGWEDATWWCKTAEDAIKLLNEEYISIISFDHDLGEGLTGYDVAKEIEKLCAEGQMRCPEWFVHSANPVGRKNIEAAMKSAERFS